MRTAFLTLVLIVFGSVSAGASSAQAHQGDVAKKKTSPERMRGMKAALAVIETGILKQKLAFPFAPPPWIVEYIDLAKKECGIDIELGRDATGEGGGYNDVMRAEIEHRFGQGILGKLAAKAEAEHLKNKKK